MVLNPEKGLVRARREFQAVNTQEQCVALVHGGRGAHEGPFGVGSLASGKTGGRRGVIPPRPRPAHSTDTDFTWVRLLRVWIQRMFTAKYTTSVARARPTSRAT
jgi:hypothetical protein